MGAAIAAGHGGQVPDTMEALVALPGVGRKTANVVLGNAFGKDEGFVVDTHVGRLAKRLGFTRQTDPVKVEQDLNAVVPRGRRTLAAHLLIFHGRRICTARKPACPDCPVETLCPKIGV
jgi:endonuclease-3